MAVVAVAVTVTGIVGVVVMGTALADRTGNAMSVANQDTLHASAAFVWDPVAWAVADVVAVVVAGAQGIAGARVMEEGATALVAALQGAAVYHLGGGAVSASHQQLMIVMPVMHLLMPPMDLVAAAGAKKLIVEHYLFVLLKMCVMKSSCWLVHYVMGSSKLPSNCLNWVKVMTLSICLVQFY